MNQQIAVRLPEKFVAFLDGIVRIGAASSRAAVVANAPNGNAAVVFDIPERGFA